MPGFHQGAVDKLGQGRLVGTLQHRHGFRALESRHQLGLRERLQHDNLDQTDLETPFPQVRQYRPHVLANRADTDHDEVGVLAVKGFHWGIIAAGQGVIFVHRLTHQARHIRHKVGAVVGHPGLEIRLVLHRTGQARIVHIHQGGDKFAGASRRSVDPLAAPLGDFRRGQMPRDFSVKQLAAAVIFDGVGVIGAVQERPQRIEGGGRQHRPFALQELTKLENPTFGTKQDFLSGGGTGNVALGVAQVFLDQRGFRQARFAHHVGSRETVHAVRHRNQGQRRGAVRNQRQVRGLLRVRPKQDRVTGWEQGIYVVVAAHHIQRVAGHHARRDLQHEAADTLADSDEVGLQTVEDTLRAGGVRDELAAGQGRAHRPGLGGVLTLGLKEEGVLAPHVLLTRRHRGFEGLRDFRRRRDGIADDTPAHHVHHAGNRAVAVDNFHFAGILRLVYHYRFLSDGVI